MQLDLTQFQDTDTLINAVTSEINSINGLMFAVSSIDVKQYFHTALWSSIDIDNGRSLDDDHGIEDLDLFFIRESLADIYDFIQGNLADINYLVTDHFEFSETHNFGSVLHDFWLTRNRHGAGFWDGDCPKHIGDRLTSASHVYGEVDLYVGDDGKIYG